MDPDGTTLSLLLFSVATALHSIFTALSVAITVSSERRLREHSAHSNFIAARAVRRRAPYYLNSCHVALLVTAAAIGAVLTLFAVQLYARIGQWLPEGGVWGASAASFGCALALLFLAGGLSQGARMIAFLLPERTLLSLARTVLAGAWLLEPVVSVVHFVPRRIARFFARFGAASAPAGSSNGAPSMQAEEEMHSDEREMIEGVFLLSDTVVREVMTPRADIISVPESSTLEELLNVFQTEKLSRLVVTAGSSLDHVRGVLHLKDLLPYFGQSHARFEMRKVMRPAFFVSNAKSVSEVLRELRKRATHLAVVLDEHGGVDGVLTVEDLLEEIVGDIFDEFDSPAQEAPVRRTRGGDLLVQGSCLIDDLNADYPFDIPRGEYDTLAGFVIHELGRIPEQGEVLMHGKLKLTVEEVDDNRIVSVRLSKTRSRLALAQPNGADGEQGSEPGRDGVEDPPAGVLARR